MVTVVARASTITRPRGMHHLKSARKRMDIVAAYEEVGPYRGAAAAQRQVWCR